MKYDTDLKYLINDLSDTQAISETCKEIKTMRRVWRGVIFQAIVDAMSNSMQKRGKIYKMKALKWLTGDSEDFIVVCHYAGFEPEYIKEKVRIWMRKGRMNVKVKHCRGKEVRNEIF